MSKKIKPNLALAEFILYGKGFRPKKFFNYGSTFVKKFLKPEYLKEIFSEKKQRYLNSLLGGAGYKIDSWEIYFEEKIGFISNKKYVEISIDIEELKS